MNKNSINDVSFVIAGIVELCDDERLLPLSSYLTVGEIQHPN